MKALGVIVEYNPFHNGHLYHLETSKEKSGADIVIAAMSGNFLQRGEPALVNKWYRANMAILAGVDIVIELPYKYATQKAETFAHGAVSILDALQCDSLCFGSEDGQLSSFLGTRSLIETNYDTFQSLINQYIKIGISYPKALAMAFKDLSPSKDMVDLSKPNNILGYHYIEALDKINSKIKPMTIKRKNAEYHDEEFTSETIASATSIRKAIFQGEPSPINQFIPNSTKKLLENYIKNFGNFHHWENYYQMLRFRLIHSQPEEIRRIYEIEEGLENRFIKAAITSQSFLEFMETVKTKRYTWTRLQRAALHILTNTTKEEMLESPTQGISYLRLLGMSTKGQEYLNKIKKEILIPIVTKASMVKEIPDLALDIKASQIYGLGLDKPYQKSSIGLEFNHAPIRVNPEY